MMFDPASVPNGTLVFTSSAVRELSPDFSGMLSSQFLYSPINVSSVSVTINARVGRPDALSSCVTVQPRVETSADNPIVVIANLRDAGGYPIACSEQAASLVSASFKNDSGKLLSVRPSDADSSTCELSIVSLIVGQLQFNVSLSGSVIPSGTFEEPVTAVRCNEVSEVTLDGMTCSCKAGHFKNSVSGCEHCPKGSYNPDVGRVGRGS
jgi:hypothetical protein